MPAIYAHNKFGKLVANSLSEDLKDVIKKYPRSFRIGLQGPDYLFFYRAFCKNKVNQEGVRLHHSDAYEFMENALDVIKDFGKDSSCYSYLLGFICHFALDNGCHPFINKSVNECGCGHIEIEGDFENLLLLKDGFAPDFYPLWKLIPTDFDTACSMVPFYPQYDAATIQDSLRWFRTIKKIFVAPGLLKRTSLEALMHATFHYKRLNGHLVKAEANPDCRYVSLKIEKLMKSSVPTAVDLINCFDRAVDGYPLVNDFHKDFGGHKF